MKNSKTSKFLDFFGFANATLIAIFLSLFVLTLIFVNNQKANLITAQLEDRATKFSIETAETLRLSVENLQAASSIMVFFEKTSFEQFKGVSSHYFKTDPGLLIIEWQPVVNWESREQFELNVRQSGLPNFRLWEPDEHGKPIAAKEREEHVPVLYMASKSQEENDINTLGLDLAWSPERLQSKLIARDTARAQASELFRVITSKSNEYRPLGFAITLPVYKKGYIPNNQPDRRKNLIGYMAGVYSVEQLMQNQIQKLLQDGINIDVFDHLNNENKMVLNAGTASDISTQIDMDFFGNTLKLKLTATEDYIAQQQQLSWLLLPGTLALFGLITFTFLFLLENKNRRLKETQEQLLVSNEKLNKLSRHDPLTGLYNRRAFNKELKHELERLQRHQHTTALLMLDLDLFKNINDRWGHPVGDQALITFAKHCLKQCRKVDTIGRLGGEEFAILISETNHEDALLFAERIRKTTELLQVPVEDNNTFCQFTVSIGISIINQPMHPDKLLEQADKALYLAKQSGRNRVEEYK